MARGKATPASFKKGDIKPVLAGMKSRRNLPQDIKDARLMNANEFENIIYKCLSMNKEQLTEIFKNPLTPAKDLVVIKILTKAIETGDHTRLNFLLERTIGKVVDKIEVQSKVAILTLHDALINTIEGED